MNLIDKEQEEQPFANYDAIIKAQAKEFVRVSDPKIINKYVNMLNRKGVQKDGEQFTTTIDEIEELATECLVVIVKKHNTWDLTGGLITATPTDYGMEVKKMWEEKRRAM